MEEHLVNKNADTFVFNLCFCMIICYLLLFPPLASLPCFGNKIFPHKTFQIKISQNQAAGAAATRERFSLKCRLKIEKLGRKHILEDQKTHTHKDIIDNWCRKQFCNVLIEISFFLLPFAGFHIIPKFMRENCFKVFFAKV